MIPLFIAILVALGAGGTVVASDSARPGDLLFPIDRAVEEFSANFASAEGKAELKVKFAEERLDEIDSILDDESATTTPNGVSEEAKLNLSHALDILTGHLADIHGAASTTPPGLLQAISVIEDRLQNSVGSLPQELKIKIRDDRGRIELKTEEGKVKVKIDSDGEIEVEIEEEDDDSDDDSNKGSNSGSGKSASSTKQSDDDDSDFKIEADVFTDITEVEVEVGGQKSSFTTSAKTRAAIVAEIVSRYPLFTAVAVDAALELEVEDRASEPEDLDAESSDDSDEDDASDDDSDDDSADSDDDEDGDDDNSGSGSNSGSSNN